MEQSDKLLDHLINQENILQSTRNMHYVFQAIFLGIDVALIAIGYSFATNIKPGDSFLSIGPITLLIVFCASIFVMRQGKVFLDDYSERVLSRGLVLDLLHHLYLLDFRGRLSRFLTELTGVTETHNDIVFVLIKISEQIARKKAKLFWNSKDILGDLAKKSLPYSEVLTLKNLNS